MVDLTAFLLERIAEDEAVARAATVAPWTADAGGIRSPGVPVAMQAGWDGTVLVGRLLLDRDGDHIARHDPARVLAECEALRRIVEDIVSNDYTTSPAVTDGLSVRVLEYLAQPYADRPDFDPAWRL